MRIILTLAMLMFWMHSGACSQVGSREDAGLDGNRDDGGEAGDFPDGQDTDLVDRDDEGAAGDGGDNGGLLPGDGYPERHFVIVIPAGTQACTVHCGDVFWCYSIRGRISFREGALRLPGNRQAFEADFIERFEVGPDREEILPVGPGVFTRNIEGTPDDGKYRYEYIQYYEDFNKEPYLLTFRAVFRVENGQAVDSPAVLDEDTLTNDFDIPWTRVLVDRFELSETLGDGSDLYTQMHWFTTCRHELYSLVRHTVRVANGDLLTMDQRIGAGRTNPTALVAAKLVHGGEEREVGEPSRLLSTSGHHDWFESFLIVFDEPVGEAYSLYLHEEKAAEKPTRIFYLDAEFNVLDTVDIDDYDIEWL